MHIIAALRFLPVLYRQLTNECSQHTHTLCCYFLLFAASDDADEAVQPATAGCPDAVPTNGRHLVPGQCHG
jgi:hypothetical protein